MHDERERILRLVNRARARLETLRLLDGAARGALLGGAAGLAALLADKVAPGLRFGPAAPWILLLLGVAAGSMRALLSARVSRTASALYLDERLGTQERIVTVLCNPPSPFTERVVAELATARAVPRMRLPRSAATVPAALFVLFAAGLLPERGGAPVGGGGSPALAAATAAGAGAAEPLPDVRATVERLERGGAPSAEEEEGLREAIARGLHRPEERRRAQQALDEAIEGDGAAGRRVARAIRARFGGRGEAGDEEAGRPAAEAAGGADGVLGVVAYPEARELVLAYRRALAELEERNR